MANEDKDKKVEDKTIEFKKKLTEALEEARLEKFSFEVRNGYVSSPQSLAPSITILLRGGDATQVRRLGFTLEKLILDFAEKVV